MFDNIYAEQRAFATQNSVPIMLDDALTLLKKEVNNISPKSILEIGTAIGYSGLNMLELAKDARLYTVEIDPERAECARKWFKAAQVSQRVEIWEGDATQIIPLVTGGFDFILLDGPKGQYGLLFPYLVKLLNKGGKMFIDNLMFKGKTEAKGLVPHKNRTIVNVMRNLINTIISEDTLESCFYNDVGDGVCVINYR